MARKNLLSLHEAIAVALLNSPDRKATFNEIASFIEKRNLYPERKGNVSLPIQIMLRSTKSNGDYSHLFEVIDTDTIKLRS